MSFDELPQGWKLRPLEDVMEAIIDYRGKTPKKTESGIPLITAKIVKGGYVLEPFEFIAEDNYDSWMVRGLPKVGDVVLTTEAPLGETAQLTSANVALAQRIVTLRGKKGLLNNDFLLCALQSDFVQHQLESRASGSTVKGIKQSELRKVSLPIPPMGEQLKISSILKSLSNKLVCNIETNQTLEEMAQALFKSWFVDFDPVKAKMNGEQPEGMDDATASLFPEKLVETELGLIPEGWHIQNTQDLFEVRDGTHDSPKKAENGYYLVTSKHITKGKIDTSSAYLISELDFEQVNQRSKVDTFDILLTMIGTVGEVVVVYDNPVEFAIKNVGLFKTSQKPELVWLFYWHLQSFKMKNYLEVRMAGTTQQYLTLKTLRTIPVLVPSQNLLQKFNELISPLMGKISDNHNQNQSLSELRDTLLPKLLSGEIELAEKQEN